MVFFIKQRWEFENGNYLICSELEINNCGICEILPGYRGMLFQFYPLIFPPWEKYQFQIPL